MNRQQRRFSDSYHKKEVKKTLSSNEWTAFEDRTSEAAPKFPNGKLLGFYANNLFSIQCFEVRGVKVYGIRRHDQATNISWETKQRIKNEIIGKDISAIEVFPRDCDLVDQANMYWLWVVDCSSLNLQDLKF